MRAPENEDVFTTWSTDLDQANATLVCLCGELDASTAPSFLSDLQKVAGRGQHIILDVHLLSYIDSTGVAAVMSTKNAVQMSGRKMRLVGCHGLLTKILHITHFDSELQCFDDVESAVADLGGTQPAD